MRVMQQVTRSKELVVGIAHLRIAFTSDGPTEEREQEQMLSSRQVMLYGITSGSTARADAQLIVQRAHVSLDG
jgi:hypothetical protein